jgi:autotransporter-associated beta strand protein
MFRSKGATIRRQRPTLKLRLEDLESRLAPAAFTWTGGGGTSNENWSSAANWGGTAPTGKGGEDLVFPSTANTFTSNNDLNGGSPPAPATFNSITFTTAGSATTYNLTGNTIILASNGSVTSNAGSGANETIALSMQLAGSAGTVESLVINPGNSLTLSGKLSGTGGAGLVKKGTGSLYLTNDNSGFTGPLTINNDSGFVQITNATALGSGTDPANVTTVGQNSQLQMKNVTGSINVPLILNGPGVSNDGALLNVAGNNTWSGTVALNTDGLFGVNAGSLNISGVISDLGSSHNVTKSGAGELIFSAANTYRGSTSINNGILDIQNAKALGTADGTAATGTTVNDNPVTGQVGTLQLEDPTGVGFTVVNELLTLNGSTSSFNGQSSLENVNGNNDWDGTIILGSPSTNNMHMVFGVASPSTTAPNTNLTIDGVITDPNHPAGVSGVAPTTLQKLEGGRLILTNANTYTGATHIEAGYITATDSQALGPSNEWTIADSATSGSFTLSYGGKKTSSLAYNATAAQVQSALSAILPTGGTVVVTPTSAGYTVLFGGSLAGSYNLPLTSSNSSVVPTYVTITIALSSALELQTDSGFTADGRNLANDTVTGVGNKLTFDYTLGMSGTGIGGTGAVHSISGINTWTGGKITMAGTAGFGVEPDPHPSDTIAYFTNDYSLTILSQLFAGSSTSAGATLEKEDGGQLILPNANPNFFGPTNIKAGWITIQNAKSLGDFLTNASDATQQPTTIAAGAALHLKPLTPGANIDLVRNLIVAGTGITSNFPLINQKGAVMSLGGNNIIGGPDPTTNRMSGMKLNGVVGIGVEEIDPAYGAVTPSELTISAAITDQSGGQAGGITKLGSRRLILQGDNTYSGDVLIQEGVLRAQGDTALGQASTGTASGTETYTTTTTTVGSGIAAVQSLTVTGSGGTFSLTFNGQTTKTPLAFNATAADVQSALNALSSVGGAGGSVTVNQSSSVYTVVFGGTLAGANQPQLTAATLTGSNTVTPATLVPGDGAALELQGAPPTTDGGISAGIQLWNEHLVLSGTGNTTFGDTPLAVLSQGDNMWHGPVTLATNSTLNIGPSSRLILFGTVDDAVPHLIHDYEFQNSLADRLGGPSLSSNGGTVTSSGYNFGANQGLSLSGALPDSTNYSIEIVFNLTSIGTDTSTYDRIIDWLNRTSQNGLYSHGAPPNATLSMVTGASTTSGPNIFANGTNVDLVVTRDGSSGVFTAYINGVSQFSFTDSTNQAVESGAGVLNFFLDDSATANEAAPGTVSKIRIFSGPLSGGQVLSLYNGGNGNGALNASVSASGSDLTLSGGGDLALAGTNTYRGTTYVNQGTLDILNSQALGGTGVAAVQTITFGGASSGSYTLTFNGQTTKTPLAFNATAATVEAELKKLSTIGDVGGSVTVSGSGNVLTVTFGGQLLGFAQPQLIAAAVSGGVTVTTGTLVAGGGGTVVANGASVNLQGDLTIVGEPLLLQGAGRAQTTYLANRWFSVGPAPINGGQTPGNQAVTGRITGVVTDPSDNNIIYIATASGGAWKTGDGGKSWTPLFDQQGNGTAPSIQTVTITGTSGTFTLTFNGQTTAPLAYNASAATVQAALDGLSTIGGVGGAVTVKLASGVYTITFGGSLTGFQPPLTTDVQTDTTTDGSTINEVQNVVVTGSNNGTFTLAFGGVSTGNLATNASASTVQTALNGLSSINTGGGSVAVTSSGTTTITYAVTFNGGPLAGTVQSLLTATAGTNSTATVSLVVSGSTTNEVQTVNVNMTSGTYTLSFGGKTTAALAASATASQVQTALQGLSSIGANNVYVTQTGSEVQTVSVSGTAGTFTLTLNGQTTTSLDFSAAASDIQTALEGLSNVGTGNVSVTATGTNPNTFAVTFIGALAGTIQPAMTATGANGTTVTVNSVISNNVLTVTFVGTLGGADQAQITAAAGGVGVAIGSSSNGGPIYTNEEQLVTVAGSGGNNQTGTFTLTFGTGTNPPTTTSLAYNASAGQVQAALNKLSSIGGVNGSVVVRLVGTKPNVYAVTFEGDMLGQGQQLLVATASGGATVTVTRLAAGYGINPEVQQLAGAGSSGQYTLTLGDQITTPLDYNATPAQIQSALQALSNVGGVGGDVIVQQPPLPIFDVTFSTADILPSSNQVNNVAQPLLTATAQGGDAVNVSVVTKGSFTPGQNEIQDITITETSGTFTVTFNNQTTGSLAYNIAASGGFGSTSSLQNALNNLSSISGGHGGHGNSVSVSLVSTGVYQVTFNGGSLANASQNLMIVSPSQGSSFGSVSRIQGGEASVTVKEVQRVTVTGNTGTFKLSFTENVNGTATTQTTTDLNWNDTSQNVANALNALQFVGGGGGGGGGGNNYTQVGSVSVTSGNAPFYTVTFGGTLLGLDMPQLTATNVSGDAGATLSTQVNGRGITAGIQSFTVSGTTGTFTLTFNGASTVPLPVGATAAQVQAALNELSTIGGLAASVSVTQTGNLYAITFYNDLAGNGLPQLLVAGSGGATATLGAVAAGTPNNSPLFVGAITMDPNDPRTLYIGTGDTSNSTVDSFYGTGIYVTHDGGATWTVLTDSTGGNPLYGKGVSQILLDNSGNLYAAVGDGGSGKNDVQTLNFQMPGGDQTYTLSFTGADSTGAVVTDTTPSLTYFTQQGDSFTDPVTNVVYTNLQQANADEIQYYLNQLGNIGGINGLVTVTPPSSGGGHGGGGQSSTYTITFGGNSTQNALSLTAVNLVLVNSPWSTTPDPRNGVYGIATKETVVGGPLHVVNGTTGGPGVWRYNSSGWFNLTAVVSSNRASTKSANTTAPPNPNPPKTPGPDDNYLISFPQTGATWSSLALINGTLLAALATDGGQFTKDNGVFYTTNPTSNSPIWLVGDPTNANPNPPPANLPDGRSTGEFPTGSNGNIKLAVGEYDSGSGVQTATYALVTTLAGGANTILVSTNSGVSWASMATQPNNQDVIGGEGWYAASILVRSNSPTAYLAGYGTSGLVILETTDAGVASWTDISKDSSGNGPHAAVHALSFDGTGGSDNVIFAATDGGLWEYNGSKWFDLNGNLEISEVNSVASSPTDPNTIYAGSAENGAEEFTGSLAWKYLDQASNTFISGGGPIVVDPSNPQNVFHVQYQPLSTAVIRASTDGGTTWNTSLSGSRLGTATAVLVIDQHSPSRLVAGGNDVFETTNGGSSWTNLNAGLNGGTAVALAIAEYQGAFVADASFPLITDQGSNSYDSKTIYVTDGSNIFLTKDDGQTWVNRTGSLGGFGGLTSLQVDPRNRDVVYVIRNVFGAGHVFVSTDAGLDWTDISGNLPNQPTWTLVLDPREGDPNAANPTSGDLYIGNDTGVWKLPSGSDTWQPVGAGLPNVQVRDLDLNQTTNVLLAATYGRGVFEYFISDGQANAGALRAASGSSIWLGSVILAGPTTIGTDGSQDLQNNLSYASLTLAGVVSDLTAGGNYALTKIGDGNLVLSGTNTYGGTTEVQDGIVVVQNTKALGGTTNGTMVDAGAALELTTSLGAEPLTLQGDGVDALYNGHNTGALRNISGNNVFTGTITLGTSTTIGVDSNQSLTITSPGGIVGAAADNLTKELSGLLILASANTFGGTTVVSQGVLQIQNSLALGNTSGLVEVLNGAQLQLQTPTTGPNASVAVNVNGKTLELSGSGISGTGALLDSGGSNTWGGAITLFSLPSFSPEALPVGVVAFGVTNAGDVLTVSGSIGESPASGLSKVGAGELVFSSANSYTGTTYINGGALAVQDSGALGSTATPDVQRITIGGTPGTFTLTFNGQTTPALSSSATVAQVQTALNALSSIGGVSGSVTVSLDTTTATTPTDVLTYNIYTIIFGGLLAGLDQPLLSAIGLGGATASASRVADGGIGTQVNAGGALLLDGDPNHTGGGAGINISGEVLTLNSGGVASATGNLENVSGTNTWSGKVVLESNSSIGVDAGTQMTITGNIQDPTPTPNAIANVTKVGAGTLVLPNSNSYTGSTFINAGILNIQNAGALGAASANEVQTVALGGANTGSFTLTFNGQTTGALAFNIPASGGTGPTASLQNALNALSSINTSEVQTVTIGGTATGSFRLTFNKQTTSALAVGTVTAGQVQSALNNLSSIKDVSGSVTVTQSGNVFTITFGGSLASMPLPLLTASPAGGTTAQVAEVVVGLGGSVSVTQSGTSYAVTFGGALALTHLPLFLGAGANGTTVTITETTAGSGGAVVAGGATLQLQGAINVTGKALTLNGAGAFGAGALDSLSGNNTWGGPVVLGSNAAVGVGAPAVQTVTVTGTAGTFTLTFNGQTTFDLAYNVPASGGTGATASLENALNALSTIGGVGGYVTVTKTGSVYTVVFQGTLNGKAQPTMTWPGVAPPTVQVSPVATGSGATTTLTMNQAITDGGSGFGLTKVGAGTLDETGGAGTDNTYTGLTQVNQGTLLLDKNGAQALKGDLAVGDTLPGNALVQWNFASEAATTSKATVNSDGTLDLHGQTQTLAKLTVVDGLATTGASGTGQLTIGGLSMTGGTVSAAAAGSAVILAGDVTATSDASGPATISGAGNLSLGGATRTFTVNAGTQTNDLVVNAVITGTGSEGLTKAAGGQMQITAANTYSGLTNVSGGDAQVDGTVSDVSLTGGTLSGKGTVATITGQPPTNAAAVGTVSPGDNGSPATAVGILTSGSATWGNSTTFAVNLSDTSSTQTPVAGTDYDQLQVNGFLDLGGATLTGSVSGSIPVGDKFTIIQISGGTLVGAFTQGGTVYLDGNKFTVKYDYTNGKVILEKVLASATLTVAPSVTAPVYGQAVTFTATLKPETGAIPTTDTVSFTFDGVTYPAINVDATGKAVFDPQTATGGALSVTTPSTLHTLTATYSGDATLFNPTGPVALSPSLPVSKASTTVSTPTFTPATPLTDAALVITTNVAASLPSGATAVANATPPGGTVTFKVDSTTYPAVSVPASGIVNSPSLSGLSAGNHSVTITYSGDGNYNAPAATTTTFAVVKDAPTITVAAVPSTQTSSFYGQSVSFKATIGPTGGSGTPTGTVTFYLDSVTNLNKLNATPITLSGGTASLPALATLPVGTHSIIAVYSGDTIFANGQNSLASFVVNADTTTTTLGSSAATAATGQVVTFTANVSNNIVPGGGVPTGTVSFIVNGVTQTPAVALDATGKATFNYTFTSQGAYQVSATYNPTLNPTRFATSSPTSPVSETILAATTTTLGVPASTNPAVFGQTVTVTATVKPTSGSGTPTGSVSISVDGGTATKLSLPAGSNQVTFTVPAANLTVGSHTITALYSGDNTSFAPTPSNAPATLTEVVNRADTTAILFGISTAAGITSTSSSVYGETDSSIYAQILAKSPGAGRPTGTVVFTVDGTTKYPVALDGNALASIPTSVLSLGNHTITLTYGSGTIGDANFNASSTATPFSAVVSKASTTSTVTLAAGSSSPSVSGQSVTFVGKVSTVAPGGGTPTGTAEFVIDGTRLPTAYTLDGSGQVSFSLSNLLQGPHSIGLHYDGNSNYSASDTPSPLSHVVGKVTTALSGATSPSGTAVYGQSVTLSGAIVLPAGLSVNIAPTGWLGFVVDGVGLPLPAPGALQVNGLGPYTFTLPAGTSLLTVGSHAITIGYSGDGNFQAAGGGLVNLTVSPAGTTTQLVASTNPAGGSTTVAVGDQQTVTYTATVSVNTPGVAGLTGSLHFFVDGTDQGPSTLNAAGQATFNLALSKSPSATHTVEAHYVSNTTNVTGSQAALQVKVLNATTTALSPAAGSAFTATQAVNFTATVSSSTAGTIGGSVTFLVDGVQQGSPVTVTSAGVATNSLSLNAGTHSVTAVYSGDGTNYAGSSVSQSYTVNPAATFASVTASGSSATTTYGQTATFTGTVTPAAPATGSLSGQPVQFIIDGDTAHPVGATLNGSNQATLSVKLPAGGHSIDLVYAGSTNFLASRTGTSTGTTAFASTVNKANSAPSVWNYTPGQTTAVFGQEVAFISQAAPVAPATTVPTGYVEFVIDGTTLPVPYALNSAGQTAFVIHNLLATPHSIGVLYLGDSNFNASVTTASQNVPLTVTAASTATTLSAPVTAPASGQPAVIMARAAALSPSLMVPTGVAVFYVDGKQWTTAALDSTGQAALLLSGIASGQHVIDVVYVNSDGDFTNSMSEMFVTLTFTTGNRVQ